MELKKVTCSALWAVLSWIKTESYELVGQRLELT